MACEPSTLANDARCFGCYLTPMQHVAAQTYLLAILAGGSTDPATLANEARCFSCNMTPIQMQIVKTYLLCALAGLSDCTTPAAPTALTVDFEIPLEAQISWTYGTNPALDFALGVSSSPGGPYTIHTTFGSGARDGGVFFESSGTYYLVLYARSGASCVSNASNEVDVTV